MKNVACALLLVVAGCRSGAVDDTPVAVAPEPFVPFTVVAVVDKIEAHGMQDLITDGSVISWTVVTFLVADPETMPFTVVRAYCSGHPHLDGKPLLIGQAVTFKIPPPVQRDMIPLEQLEELQRMQR